MTLIALDQKILIASLIAISVLSGTLIVVIALTRNTDTEINIKLGEDNLVNIKGKRSTSLSEEKEFDCLPGEENSQLKRCDS